MQVTSQKVKPDTQAQHNHQTNRAWLQIELLMTPVCLSAPRTSALEAGTPCMNAAAFHTMLLVTAVLIRCATSSVLL
jgi:hypothetical protein